MGTLNDTNWVAGGTIYKYDLLKSNGDGKALVVTAADTDYPIAVATCDATTTNPGALTYELLQHGHKYSVRAAAGFSPGAVLAPAAAGEVATAAHGDMVCFLAEQTASGSDDVVVATFVGCYFLAVDN
jgi:hypothetical protein